MNNLENYITSYDDMVYKSGPNKFNDFISDKYNKVHNELYNDALQKYYSYVLSKNVDDEFFYQLFSIMRNNSDSGETLYKAIMTSKNALYVKNALIELCANSKEIVNIMYEIIMTYLNDLKEFLITGNNGSNMISQIVTIFDIRDFTIAYVDTSTFIRPESDEQFEHEFISYNVISNNGETTIEQHNFYMTELEDYVFILEDEYGTRIGFNRKGKWIIILDSVNYVSIDAMRKSLTHLKLINKSLFDDIRNLLALKFKYNHKVIEIKNNEYWEPSSIIIISKISPYNKRSVDLAKWWNSIGVKPNISIEDLKLTNENILDSEVTEINYVSGKAKLYSKSNDLSYEVPFEYLNQDSLLSDNILLTNTFTGQF